MKRFTGKNKFWYIPIFLGVFALTVLITMLLWNGLMPQIFHLPHITYWQTLGLLILFRLLLGFGGRHWTRHPHRSHLREKWSKMSPDQREKFREHMRAHHQFWNNDKDVWSKESKE